jgi:RNA polymerase sporulation-specific sigma factor
VRDASHSNQDAFAALAENYSPMIHKLLGSFKISPNDREDLFQEGLIGLYKAVMMYDSRLSSFGTFAYLCIKRSMLSAVKAYNKNTDEYEDPETALDIPDSEENRPENLLLSKESYQQLLKKIDSHLSTYENRILKLFLTGVNHDMIAQKLDTSRKSVDNAICRIRRKLKVLIEPDGDC